MTNGIPSQAGTHVTTTTVKTEPLPDEIEVYNTNRDPTEMDNLAGSSGNAGCCGSAPRSFCFSLNGANPVSAGAVHRMR